MAVRKAELAGLAGAMLLGATGTLTAWPARAGQPASPPASPLATPAPFTATYAVEWHGINAGTSTLELTQTSPQSYLYTSTDSASGVFRLVFPHAMRQSSRFRIVSGTVEPITFEAAGPGNPVRAQFNWRSGEVTGTAKGKPLQLKLQPGTQDPLSVQIAIMLALRSGAAPESFWMLNTDEIDRFQYERHGDSTVETALGRLRTILYTSHARGSDKTTYLWLAPALDYMPARAEQRVKGSTQISLRIRAFRRDGAS